MSSQVIRASDEERGRTAAALGDHYTAGRLTLEEFHERLDKAYAATTRDELDELVADLPGTDLRRLPGGPVQVPAYGSALARRAPWRFWVGIGVGFFVIWLISGPGGPWLLWVALLLGLLVLWRRIGSGPRHDRHRGGTTLSNLISLRDEHPVINHPGAVRRHRHGVHRQARVPPRRRRLSPGTFGIPGDELRPFPASRARGDAEAMSARHDRASQAPSAAPLFGAAPAGPPSLDRACCCVARAVVRVVMPSAPGRPHETELLLCGHHYRVSRDALATAHARVEELGGGACGAAAWFHDRRTRTHALVAGN